LRESLTRRTLTSELKVLLAFNRREFLNYVRYPLNPVFDLLMEPLYFVNWLLIGLFYVGVPTSANLMTLAGTGDYISYLFLGGVLMSFARGAVDTVGNSLRTEMRTGTLESCWIAPISRFTLLTGRIILNLVFMAAFNLLSGLLIYAIFNPVWNLDWTTLFLILILTLLSNYSFGILMGGVVVIFKEIWSFRQLFMSALWVLAGASFPVEVLPVWAQSLSRVVPYYYSLKDFRAVVLKGSTLSELSGDLLLLLVFSAVSMMLSYALFKRLERIAKRKGTLGLY